MSRDPQRFSRLLRTAAVVGAVVVAIVVFRAPLLRACGRLLVAEDPLEAADVVVIPQWTENAGALEAADLVARGMSSRVAVLVNDTDPSTQELMRRGVLNTAHAAWPVSLIKDLGVADVVQIGGTEGTESEAEALPRWCAEHHYRAIILVTTADHSRRTRRVLKRAMRGQSTKVIVHLTPYGTFDPNRWWRTRGGVRTEVVELQKLILDLALHPLS